MTGPSLDGVLVTWGERLTLAGRLVLNGLNHHPTSGIEVAQTWLMLPTTDDPKGAGELMKG